MATPLTPPKPPPVFLSIAETNSKKLAPIWKHYSYKPGNICSCNVLQSILTNFMYKIQMRL
jgi:hypothetical protein